MIKKLVIGISAWATAASGLLIGRSWSSNDIVFGNYSDYISSDVAQELREKYQLRVDLFDYDHLVKERFQKGIYDMAIVSTSVLSELKSSNAAMKLDWSKLLKKEDVTNSGNGQLDSNTALSKARELFTDIVKDMSHDLLEYGIPYFVQKLSFYYIGDPIEGLRDGQKVSFKDLVNKVSNEPRFKSQGGKPQLGLIDDPRTVLSFARKVAGKQDVNPKENDYPDSNSILKDYRSLIDNGLSRDKLGKDFLLMSPDSGTLVDALSGGDIKGAFMYNGDGLFAAYGGNAKKEPEKFHTVELSENIFFLDFLTFSEKMPKHKLENAYKLAKDLLFITEANKENPFKRKGGDGSSKEEENDEEDSTDASNNGEDDDEPPYEEMAIRNFDEVGYTPTLKSVYEKLDKDYFDINDEPAKPATEGTEKIKSKLKSKIIKVEKTVGGKLEHEYEKQISAQQKSDMLIAYSNFKLLI
ncbi:hypothetical protein A6V39_02235 [Candidatus Mycoplasma haematobovis]|uniref:Spermidine/putrescine ABC transporter substrate-binding protein n=1 Tax=Candidatus Mycoplasma haematobovis TaxID=432608 RepID=A0A1A9QEX4_9MOLU|nr:spermidine/putrescine ABC transporter substrate-binding protein [Candidatus Mycoplasma haematobovis]OAL10240.1 hypothetical protein A6V39_02235 [Candidatus Mycoplasma haematobovis]